MKKLFVSVLFVAVTLGAFTSCNKDDDYGDGVGIEFRLRNEDYGADAIKLFEIDSVSQILTGYGNSWTVEYYPGYCYLEISSSNNFSVYPSSTSIGCGITCVGRVNNIGKIKNIPNSGWSELVAVQPGNGYVVRGRNAYKTDSKWHYARIYVVDWIESTDGGIIGALVKYQTEWNIE